MARWNGTVSSDFFDAANWDGGVVGVGFESETIISSHGLGSGSDPTVIQGAATFINNLIQSARTFRVQGEVAANSVTLSESAVLVIGSDGIFRLLGDPLNMTSGILRNFGSLDGNLQMLAREGVGFRYDVDNRGEITGAVTVSGGTFTLNEGSNLSDSATLTVNAGGSVVVFEADAIGALAGSGEVELRAGNHLRIGGVVEATFSGVIFDDFDFSGGIFRGGVDFLDSGTEITQILSGNNTYTGGTFIGINRTLQVGDGGSTGSLGSGAVVNDGALVFNRADDFRFDNAISGSGTLTNAGWLILTGNNSYSGRTVVQQGALLQVGDGGTTGSLGTGSVELNVGPALSSLDFFRSDDFTVGNRFSGAGILNKYGTNILTLSGVSDGFIGTTNVWSGELNVTGAIGAGLINVGTDARLRVDGTAISDTASVALNDNGNLTLTGSESIGSLAGSASTSTVTLGAHTLTLGRGGSDTFAGVISGTGGLTKVTDGNFFTAFGLSGANTYTGATTISGGVLDITGSIVSQAVNVTRGILQVDGTAISDSAVVTLNAFGRMTLNGSERIGALVSGASSAVVTLNGHELTLGDQTVGLGTMTFLGSAGADRLTVNLDSAVSNFNLHGVNFSGFADSTDIISINGNILANRLTGNTVNNMLSGGQGDDALFGDGYRAAYDLDDARSVYRLYQATLDRVPDVAGQVGWTELLASDARTLVQVAADFVGSREFRAEYGTLTNSAFVRLLYENVLNRAPDAAGLASWTNALASGTSRAQVVTGFSESAEFRNITNAAATKFTLESNPAVWQDDVFRLYQAAFDRAPDAGGFMDWLARLGGGTSFLSAVGGFVGSREFQNTYGALDDASFVTLLYNNVLDRAPDDAGLTDWLVRILVGGMTRAEVVQGFSQSREFINASAPDLKAWIRAQGQDDVLAGNGGSNSLSGGAMADVFVFNVTERGTHRINDFEVWDYLDFNFFNYTTAADVRAHMTQQGANVVFTDQGTTVTLINTQLASLDNDTFLF